MAVVSVDLSKAFDTIPHSLLLAKLSAYGWNGVAYALLKDTLSSRRQRVKVGDAYSFQYCSEVWHFCSYRNSENT